MAIPRVKHWEAGEVLTANDLENEFNNLANNAVAEPLVVTQALDLNGNLLILDADGDTLIDPSANDTIDITIGGNDDFRFTANTFTALAGSSIVVDDGDLTLSDGNVMVSNGRVLEADGGDVFSATNITVPTTGHTFTMTGTTNIESFSETQIGTMFYVRFTGAGLNIAHNAVLNAPWGRDYRTVPNEVLCFLSKGSGFYDFWSMNGPKERVGVTIEGNVAAAPDGYLDEEQAVSRTTYSGLFQEIGTTFGVGDGSTTFDLPASKGRTIVNVDGTANRITSASTNGANADTLGGVGGAETHTLDTTQIPAHAHVISSIPRPGGSPAATITATTVALSSTPSTNTDGGSGLAHSNTQPWIAKKKYIRF